MINPINAAQISQKPPSVSLANTLVSKVTTATLNMYRGSQARDAPWQANQCFLLRVVTPYSNPTLYSTFTAAAPPSCSTTQAGLTVSCSIYNGQTDTLFLIFPSISDEAASQTSLPIQISGFKTPFSAQTLTTINLISYSDTNCQLNAQTNAAPAINILAESLPVASISLTSSSKVLSDQSSGNTLIVTFTPKTQLSPSGAGFIYITLPPWYTVGSTTEDMYNPMQINQCTSPCYSLVSSIYDAKGRFIKIQYQMMSTTCQRGQITIRCKGFYNPISPKMQSGFIIATQDDQVQSAVIEQSLSVSLDATQYSPVQLNTSSLEINPSNTSINTPSEWNMILRMNNVPLEQYCTLKIVIPNDLYYKYDTQNPSKFSGVFAPKAGTIEGNFIQSDIKVIDATSSNPLQLVFNGCQNLQSLGGSPQGAIYLSNIRTPVAVKDINPIAFYIYKDTAMTQLIAQITPGIVIKNDNLQAGIVFNMFIKPSVTHVQFLTDVTFTFTTSNDLLANAAVNITLPPSINNFSLTGNPNLTVVGLNGTTTANSAQVIKSFQTGSGGSGGSSTTWILSIANLVSSSSYAKPNTTFSFTVKGLTNQLSATDAGSFTITTYDQFPGDPLYYVVDIGTSSTSYTATPGKISANGPIQVSNPQTTARGSVYTLVFIPEDAIPNQGIITIVFPQEVSIQYSTTQSMGSCKFYTCLPQDTSVPNGSNTVKMQIFGGIIANQSTSLQIGGVTNPRSFAPTAPIIISSADANMFMIDTGYNASATMTIAAPLQSFTVTAATYQVGLRNVYTFSAQTNVTILPGDNFVFNIPKVMRPARDLARANCKPLSGVTSVTCQINGYQMIVTLNQFGTAQSFTGAFSWQIGDIGNPPSTKTSDTFSQIQILDSKKFVVAEFYNPDITITNQIPHALKNYTLVQVDNTPGAITNYSVIFTPYDPIPSGGSIQIGYPQQIQLNDGYNTICIVSLQDAQYKTTATVKDACQIDLGASTITLQNLFDGIPDPGYLTQITVLLVNVQNPLINKPGGNGFTIATYADSAYTYIQDRLNDFILVPTFPCEYPCKNCSASTPNSCSSCWLSDLSSPQYLMPYSNKPNTCLTTCDEKFTSNGDPNLKCIACDVTCSDCFDQGTVGDYKNCTSCSPDYPFTLTPKPGVCLANCELGLYQSTNVSCDYCVSPCQACSGTPSKCTACDPMGTTPFLYKNTCLNKCPVGYLSIKGECQKCNSPCASCAGTLDTCTLCDGSNKSKFIMNGTCYASCPSGYAPVVETDTCVKCKDDCDLCDSKNISTCFVCNKPLLVYENQCVASCPSKWVINSAGTACRPWVLADWGMIYFPFLIAAAVLSLIVRFGVIVERGTIVGKKAVRSSLQNTLTCILVVIAPIQSLATCAQWILSYINGTITFAILAAVVTVLTIVLSVILALVYYYMFASKKDGGREDKDFLFMQYKKQHCFAYYAIATLSYFNIRFNKLFYSRLYSSDAFSARWEKANKLRKYQQAATIVFLIFVDLILICIDITGFLQIGWGNQLFITMIETMVLSLLSFILGAYELSQQKTILLYTELTKREKMLIKLKQKADKQAEDNLKILDKKNIGDMVKKVKSNKSRFLNNKLDELMGYFDDLGSRSMFNLYQNEDNVKDDRELRSWPVSPRDFKELRKMPKVFGQEDIDKFQAFEDNCYADTKLRNPGHDFGTQGDAGMLEFQDALNRKHGDLMSQLEGDLEEQRMKKQVKRRGRKNKYYTQIDYEDDLEADQAEGSDREQELQVIREQEEEDEALRKLVSADAKRSLEAAANRKQKQFEEQLEKQRQEAAEEEAKKKKELELAEALKAKELKEAQIAREKELAALKTQQQALEDEQKNKQLDAMRQQELLMQSALERAEYEAKEAARQAAHLAEQARLRALEEEKAKAELEMQRLLQEQELQNAKLAQQERDARELEARKKQIADDEAKRQQEKESKRLEKEKEKQKENERLEKEKADAEELKKSKTLIPVSSQEQMQQILDEVDEKTNQEAKKSKTGSANKDDRSKSGTAKDGDRSLVKDETSRSALKKQGLSRDEFEELNKSIQIADNILTNFNQFASKVDVPPNPELRTFNENDILGDLERDEKGNVIVLTNDQGENVDLQGNQTNQRGYLLDPKTGGILENQQQRVMFTKSEMDSRGEVPAPFCVEKFNFNPHNLYGDFDYQDGKPNLMQTTKGFFIDKKGRRVNKHGWMTLAGQGHLVDQHGTKKFDRRQLVAEGDLPKLFNYNGKRFDIKDLMGTFEKDSNSMIIPLQASKGGYLVDNLGRRVNDKGYLIDQSGNIIDVNNKLIWKASDLKNGEFPKIFPFTKFNISRVQGDFEMNPSGNPMLRKAANGKLYDNVGQLVNERGYLIDDKGNVIDHSANLMFDKCVLDPDGEIPQVFRTGLLKSDTASSLSRLMSEIEKNHPSEYDRNEEAKMENDPAYRQKNEGETSVDSAMEDTPANYNQANQRLDERDLLQGETIPEDEEGAEHMSPQSEFDENESRIPQIKRKRKKPKKPKLTTIELLEPTKRDKNMADAYGGMAKGELRRPGIKYDKERLANSKKFRVSTADEPKVRAQLQQLVNSASGINNILPIVKQGSSHGNDPPSVKRQGLMGKTGEFDSNDLISQISKSMKPAGSNSRKADSRAAIQQPKGKHQKRGMQDGDFEQMFGKDIDQFLEDSEWDIESLDKVSHNSRGSARSAANEMKLKQMEKLYLKRMEAGQAQQTHTNSMHKASRDRIRPNSKSNRMGSDSPSISSVVKRRPKDPKPPRETIIGYTDDPGVIHRGEILEFKTRK